MDDLLGEDWQKPAQSSLKAPTKPATYTSNFSGLIFNSGTPKSGTSTPQSISRPSSTVNGTKASASDSFGNLLTLKSQKPGISLSMQERQRQLAEEKLRQQHQQEQLWGSLGSGRATPEIRQPSPAVPATAEDDDDILAAFNKEAPVNKASYFSPPQASAIVSGRSTPASAQASTIGTADIKGFDNDDDDPFGLRFIPQKSTGNAVNSHVGQSEYPDDILGDLGKPVSEIEMRNQQFDSSSSSSSDDNDDTPGRKLGVMSLEQTQDKSLAELIEMGFPADTARIALAETGANVQDAVGWLLQQAHEESRQKARGDSQQRGNRQFSSRSPQSAGANGHEVLPQRRHNEHVESTRRPTGSQYSYGDKDASQVAQEFGTKFLKSASSLWKASQKQMAKTLSEFQTEGDGSQPKWMRDSSAESSRASSRRPMDRTAAPSETTNEAAMLDMPRERSRDNPRPSSQNPVLSERPARPRIPVEPILRQQSPLRFTQQVSAPQDKRPATKLSRQDVEEQTAQAYVSPARRKRAPPKPELQVLPSDEVDLFAPDSSSGPTKHPPSTKFSPPAPAQPPRTLASPKPPIPVRSIPPVSASALATSTAQRRAGGEHYKRGDFAAAHESYAAALRTLPAKHPITIVVLCNHALTALKTGDAKVAVSDANQALEIIGPGLGAGETIDLDGGEGQKDMKEFYGKAIMRKAEALEHLEKYSEAAEAWRLAVESGAGGATSARGRDRCEKAAMPKSAPSNKPKAVNGAVASSRPSSRTPAQSAQVARASAASSAQAVEKLRQANAAAEKADNEKFALTDQVDAKLAAWRNGKTDNLRALLQSMETVLWESAGWKKVGMSDLIVANKVKIIYMKAIAKVHPDKIPQDASTEQRMISGAVFSTLNEAWDKFKKDNNL